MNFDAEKNLDAEKTQTHNLHIIFKAYSPNDKTTQTFRTTVLLRVRQSIQIVFAYVGNDRLTLGNFFDFSTDHLSYSDDKDYGSDREVWQLNPAFLKVISKGKSPEKSPEKGPTYRPSPECKYNRRCTGLYNKDPELRKEIECFKTDVANSGVRFLYHILLWLYCYCFIVECALIILIFIFLYHILLWIYCYCFIVEFSLIILILMTD